MSLFNRISKSSVGRIKILQANDVELDILSQVGSHKPNHSKQSNTEKKLNGLISSRIVARRSECFRIFFVPSSFANCYHLI